MMYNRRVAEGSARGEHLGTQTAAGKFAGRDAMTQAASRSRNSSRSASAPGGDEGRRARSARRLLPSLACDCHCSKVFHSA